VHSALGLPPPTSPLLSTGLTSLDSSTQTSPYPPIVIGRVEKIRKLGKRKAYGIRRCMGTIKETWEVRRGWRGWAKEQSDSILNDRNRNIHHLVLF